MTTGFAHGSRWKLGWPRRCLGAPLFTSLVLSLLWALGLVWLLPLLILTLVGYLVSSFALVPVLPLGPPPAGVAVIVPTVPLEEFARGFVLGVNAFYNFSVLLLFFAPFALLPALSLGCAILPLATDMRYKAAVGWTAWLLPSAMIANVIGFVVIFLPSLAMLPFSPGQSYRIDWTTGAIETAGGVVNFIPTDGFVIGNFSFISLTSGVGPSATFRAAALSSHETGHTLNTAAFGGPFLLINWIDENAVQPSIPGRLMQDAYGELLAEGHYPEPGWKSILHWS